MYTVHAACTLASLLNFDRTTGEAPLGLHSTATSTVDVLLSYRGETTGEAPLQLHRPHRHGHTERAQQEAHPLRDLPVPSGRILSLETSTFR